MRRREFLGIAASAIFAPKFGKWYRQGSGLLVRDEGLLVPATQLAWEWDAVSPAIWRKVPPGYAYHVGFPVHLTISSDAYFLRNGELVRVGNGAGMFPVKQSSVDRARRIRVP